MMLVLPPPHCVKTEKTTIVQYRYLVSGADDMGWCRYSAAPVQVDYILVPVLKRYFQ